MSDLGRKVTRCGRRRRAADDVDRRSVSAALPYCSRRRRQRHVEDGCRTHPAVARRRVHTINQSINQSIKQSISHSVIQSFTHSRIQSVIHSFTH